jgi:hypothetical protein
MFGQNRDSYRHYFAASWRKQRQGGALQPLEQLLVDIIRAHPEYQPLLESQDPLQELEFAEGNPFLHMGLHVGLVEQLQTDRPAGIRDIYRRLCRKTGDTHQAEHQMMACLEYQMWQAQQANAPLDENEYLQCLKRLL